MSIKIVKKISMSFLALTASLLYDKIINNRYAKESFLVEIVKFVYIPLQKRKIHHFFKIFCHISRKISTYSVTAFHALPSKKEAT